MMLGIVTWNRYDDELTSTLTIFQALQLASLLGVRLEDLLTENVPSSSKIALLDLPSMVKGHIAREGISIEEFESRVGWELQEFLQSPVKVAAELPIMFLRDVSGPLGINWLSLAPEPRRLSRRLHTLRGWSHGNNIEAIFSRSERTCGADGLRASRPVWLAMGGDPVDASKIGCTNESLRRWVQQAERDQGVRAGLSTRIVSA